MTNTNGLTLSGAGGGAIIARFVVGSALSLANGSITETIQSGREDGTFPLGPNAGQSLTIFENGTSTNFLSGTVTSFNSGTGSLVFNVTSHGGTCGGAGQTTSNCKRWIVSIPATTIITNNNSTNTPLFSITENTSYNAKIENLQIAYGTGGAHDIQLNYTAGGLPILIQNVWVRNGLGSNPTGNATLIYSNSTTRGVASQVYCDSSPYSGNAGGGVLPNGNVNGCISIEDDGNNFRAWTTASFYGSADTGEVNNFYVETSYCAAFIFCWNTDNNGRLVSRYNVIDNAGWLGTHGADTSFYGQRYMEAYNTRYYFNGYNDGTTFNLTAVIYLRGGGLLLHDNTMDAATSTDYGTRAAVNMTNQGLQRNTGNPTACWGAGTTNGKDYPFPHQTGLGYITNTGHAPVGTITFSGGGTATACNAFPLVPTASCPFAQVTNTSGGAITAIAVQGTGTGLTSSPTVNINGPGSGATATATESGGSVNSLTLTGGGSGFTGSSTYSSGGNTIYVGDPEPAWIWGNNTVPLSNVSTTDYGGSDCTSPDTSANYIVLNRDYFNGSTAKPGYSPSTYPHPLVAGGPPTVSTPTFSPCTTAVCNNPSSASLTISVSSPALAVICYRSDGGIPTASVPGVCDSNGGNEFTYSTPVQVLSSLTITAIGTYSGSTNSAVATQVYYIGTAPAPSMFATKFNDTGTMAANCKPVAGQSQLCCASDGCGISTNGAAFKKFLTSVTFSPGTLPSVAVQ